MARISIPFNLENTLEDKESKLQEKEIKSKQHLEEMAEITRHLSYNDIKLLRKNSSGKEKVTDGKEEARDEQPETTVSGQQHIGEDTPDLTLQHSGRIHRQEIQRSCTGKHA